MTTCKYGRWAFSVAGPSGTHCPKTFRIRSVVLTDFRSTSVSSALQVFMWMHYTNLHLTFDIMPGAPHIVRNESLSDMLLSYQWIKATWNKRFGVINFYFTSSWLTLRRRRPCDMFSATMKPETRWCTGPASPQWGRSTNVLNPRSLIKQTNISY